MLQHICIISLLTSYAVILCLSPPSRTNATLYLRHLLESDVLCCAVFSSTPLKPCLMLSYLHYILDNYLWRRYNSCVISLMTIHHTVLCLFHLLVESDTAFCMHCLPDEQVASMPSSWWPCMIIHYIHIIFLKTMCDVTLHLHHPLDNHVWCNTKTHLADKYGWCCPGTASSH